MRPHPSALLRPSSVGLRIRKPGLPMPAAEWFEFSSFSPKRAARVLMPSSICATLDRKRFTLAFPRRHRERVRRVCGNADRVRGTGFCDGMKLISRARAKGQAMKIVDMSHVMNVHTPGWVGYAGNKMYYAQNLQTQMIVAQRIDTALHVGTHFD